MNPESIAIAMLVTVDPVHDTIDCHGREEVEDVTAEFNPALQTIESSEPVIGWYPYNYIISTRDEHDEVRTYLVFA